MAIKLYYLDGSPASRAVLLVVKALNLDVEYKVVNLLAGEQHSPEFLKLNPQHTVPVIEDGDLVVADSHAIVAYLAAKYGKDDSLYPKSLEKRAIVDQRLHFEGGLLFPRLGAIVKPIRDEGATTIPKEKADAVVAAYGFLEEFLKRSTFMAGEKLTIADLSIVATVSSLDAMVEISAKDFSRLTRWFGEMRKLPYYNEGNQVGLEKFVAFVKSRLTG